MVFGECPYCEEPFAITAIDEDTKTPAFLKYTCEKCGEWFWEYLSRIEPRSYLPEEIEVDEENRSVKIKLNQSEKG